MDILHITLFMFCAAFIFILNWCFGEIEKLRIAARVREGELLIWKAKHFRLSMSYEALWGVLKS